MQFCLSLANIIWWSFWWVLCCTLF